MKIKKQIGEITRTVTIIEYEWGVRASVMDVKTDCFGYPFKSFTGRMFRLTKSSSTIAQCIERAKKYYKVA